MNKKSKTEIERIKNKTSKQKAQTKKATNIISNLPQGNDDKFCLVGEKALPDVLLKVLQAKQLLESKDISIQEATKEVGISRASFYKYSSNIFPFNKNTAGKVVSLAVSSKDSLGFLSKLTGIISDHKCNILTIHQSIPINKITNISFTIEVMEKSKKLSDLVEEVEKIPNVKYCRILTMEEK